MEEPRQGPGPLEPEKRGETSEPGSPQPEAAKVERARQLAGQARERLESEGFAYEDIRRLAYEYVALDLGQDLEGFVRWARQQDRAERDRDPNLEEQTLDREDPGPGGSKTENIRRMRKQVRAQRERSDAAQREAPDQDQQDQEG
jgi:hypothetical protein